MPQNSSSTPPEVMTWGKAVLVLVLAGFFDALRAFFQFFWFSGPALAAVYCTMKALGILSTWTLGILGAKTAAALCAAGGAAAATAAIAFTAPLGVIMAEAVGLIGFLTLGLILILTNSRMLKTVTSAPWYFAGAFAVGEVPFLGALPMFTVTLWRLYKAQIRAEQAALEKWQQDHASQLTTERTRKEAEVMRTVQEAAIAQERDEETAMSDGATEEESDEIPETH